MCERPEESEKDRKSKVRDTDKDGMCARERERCSNTLHEILERVRERERSVDQSPHLFTETN